MRARACRASADCIVLLLGECITPTYRTPASVRNTRPGIRNRLTSALLQPARRQRPRRPAGASGSDGRWPPGLRPAHMSTAAVPHVVDERSQLRAHAPAPSPTSARSATNRSMFQRLVMPASVSCWPLHPVVALLRFELRDLLAVPEHGHLGAHRVVVRAFDGLQVLELVGVSPHHHGFARRDGDIPLHRVALHGRDGEHRHARARCARWSCRPPRASATAGVSGDRSGSNRLRHDDPDADHHAHRRQQLAGAVTRRRPAPGPAPMQCRTPPGCAAGSCQAARASRPRECRWTPAPPAAT